MSPVFHEKTSPLAAASLASKTGSFASTSSPVNLLPRAPTTSTVTIQDRPVVTVNVLDVSIVDINNTPIPEGKTFARSLEAY